MPFDKAAGTGRPQSTHIPVNLTNCGPSLSVNFNLARRVAGVHGAPGANVTLTVTLCPGGIVTGSVKLEAMAKSAASSPVTSIAVITSGAVPELMTTCAICGLVLP